MYVIVAAHHSPSPSPRTKAYHQILSFQLSSPDNWHATVQIRRTYRHTDTQTHKQAMKPKQPRIPTSNKAPVLSKSQCPHSIKTEESVPVQINHDPPGHQVPMRTALFLETSRLQLPSCSLNARHALDWLPTCFATLSVFAFVFSMHSAVFGTDTCKTTSANRSTRPRSTPSVSLHAQKASSRRSAANSTHSSSASR
ncbi:hypothetical protein EJ06DRAFT_339905 [Trichodelitschia bisporula]|uniref:Uncharacterized protein n=1 Tax=Trichodelitschia bisporula TaxID=703511 RepID=A0A6G1I2C6_9PEZI|nr:hypothetical protein EJ06DRAFT_339905 [Trichodelitschia bisporula]